MAAGSECREDVSLEMSRLASVKWYYFISRIHMLACPWRGLPGGPSRQKMGSIRIIYQIDPYPPLLIYGLLILWPLSRKWLVHRSSNSERHRRRRQSQKKLITARCRTNVGQHWPLNIWLSNVCLYTNAKKTSSQQTPLLTSYFPTLSSIHPL